MALSSKPEFPPLLPRGFHLSSLRDLHNMCVKPFPLSNTRRPIMEGFEFLVKLLERAGVVGNLWVNGGFLTKSIDPHDIDVVLQVQGSFIDNLSFDQAWLLCWWSMKDLKTGYLCDTYLFAEYDPSDSRFPEGKRMKTYWSDYFGSSRAGTEKGIAVVPLPLPDGDRHVGTKGV